MNKERQNIKEVWIEIELGKVCFTTSGGTPSRKIPEYYQGSIPWVKSGELNHNVIRETEEHISEEAVKNSSAKVFPEGTLLIALYGATIGKLAILGIPATTNQAVCGIYQNGLFETKFLFNYLFHKKQKLIKQSAGGAQPNISQTILKKLPVLIAPLPEQRAIVAKIEQLFSELDNGIANLKAAKAKLEIYRQAVLKKAFEGELTKEWRAEQDVKRLKDRQDGEKNPVYHENQKNHVQDNLPKGWNCVKLREVTKLNPKIEEKNSVKDDLEIQFVPMKLVDEVIDNIHLTEIRKFSEVQKKSYTYFAEGDVIFAKVTPCMENGKIAIAKGLKNGIGYGSSEFHVFRCSSVIQNYYLFYFLVQSVFRRDAQHAMTGAVGLRRVPKKFLEDYAIPLPSLPEQHAIVREIETRLSVCDNMAKNIDEALEKAEALRQSILKKAFEGKLLSEAELEACRKAPDWEPAEKLLERIKNEK